MDLRQLRGSFRVAVWQMFASNAQNGIREMRVTCAVCRPPCRRWISTRWRARTCPSPRPSACRSRGTTTSTRWSPTSTSSSPSVTRRPASPRVRAPRVPPPSETRHGAQTPQRCLQLESQTEWLPQYSLERSTVESGYWILMLWMLSTSILTYILHAGQPRSLLWRR